MEWNLRALRASRGLTQTQLAEAIGSSLPTVVSWEQGKTTPRVAQIVKLAKFYAVDPAVILHAVINN